MGIKKICECDVCHRAILTPIEGFIVRGNIYAADPYSRLGLVGNNIPKALEDGTILEKDIGQTYICKGCMEKALFPHVLDLRN